jgi:hypothetical protein
MEERRLPVGGDFLAGPLGAPRIGRGWGVLLSLLFEGGPCLEFYVRIKDKRQR